MFTLPHKWLKALLRQKLLLIGGAVLTLSMSFVFLTNSVQKTLYSLLTSSALDSASISRSTFNPDKQQTVYPGIPIRLKIPEIQVDAAVDYVALTSKGEMGTPKGPASVAWYASGPRPGEKGSSVMAGHLDWFSGKPAVFEHLNKLNKGDRLYVKDEKGVLATFVVRETRSFDEKADTTNVFISNDGKAHLNLITCGGDWDKASKSYSNRLVVFTDKV